MTLEKNTTLTGQRVRLRPITGDDAPLIRKWSSDPEIMQLTGETGPMSEQESLAFVRKVRSAKDRLWYIITLRDGNRPIGETGFLRMFPPWRRTDLTTIIGEKDCWDKGYGTETINLMLDHAFNKLKFHRVAVGVVGFNHRALHFYEKVGFKKEGLEREGYLLDNKFHHFVMMSMLEDEYRSRHPGGGHPAKKGGQ